MRANTPVVGVTSRRRASTRPATMLSRTVPSTTSRIEALSDPIRRRVVTSTRAPTVMPTSPCATRNDQVGRASGVREVSACAIPPSTAPKSTGDGTASTAKAAQATTPTATTTVAACRVERSRPAIGDTLGG